MTQFYTFLIGLLPLSELRGAIPFGVFSGLSLGEAFFYAVLGNLLVIPLVYFLLDPIVNFLQKKIPFFARQLPKIFQKTRSQHLQKFQKWEELALLVFVAIPLPGSGIYSGILLAYLFGLSFFVTFVFGGLGVIISGVIVVALTFGAEKIWQLFGT